MAFFYQTPPGFTNFLISLSPTIHYHKTQHHTNYTKEYRKNTKSRQVCTGRVSKQKHTYNTIINLRHEIFMKNVKIALCMLVQGVGVKIRHQSQIHVHAVSKGTFWTLPNIYDGAFHQITYSNYFR